jgi:hypothetical protein
LQESPGYAENYSAQDRSSTVRQTSSFANAIDFRNGLSFEKRAKWREN